MTSDPVRPTTPRPAGVAFRTAFLTAACLLAMVEAGCEWAVVEVGLGGRLDSTNIVDGPLVRGSRSPQPGGPGSSWGSFTGSQATTAPIETAPAKRHATKATRRNMPWPSVLAAT